MITSQNGYQAGSKAKLATYTVGKGRKVRLDAGAAGQLLAAFADRFDAHVEDIDAGQVDDWGYAYRPIRGQSSGLSNHASGTAIDLNATRHPMGKVGTFTRKQTAAIHGLLAEFSHAIRWGGDYHGRKDEMHFEVVVSPEVCARVLKTLRAPKQTPVDVQTARNIESGQPVAKVKRPRVRARMRQIIARLKKGTEK